MKVAFIACVHPSLGIHAPRLQVIFIQAGISTKRPSSILRLAASHGLIATQFGHFKIRS